MVRVHFTVDVEIWCDGWSDIDRKFPQAFKDYIYGTTPQGDYGLPFKLKTLNAHGLTGVFFVEPLFALRFGQQALDEIVGLIAQSGQDVELHMHTEWVDEALEKPFPEITEKRQHLRYFDQAQQTRLLQIGLALMNTAGVHRINAFRAGSFGFNTDTLLGLGEVGIRIDSSYNASQMGLDSGLRPGEILTEPLIHQGVHEVPMTVYFDRPGHLRHLQLCACSWREIEGLLWRAAEEEREHVVVLSHGSELLNPARTKPDPVIVDRFERLCGFLDRHRDSFSVQGFSEYDGPDVAQQPKPLSSPAWKTGLRMVEQGVGRLRQ